jgi:hypothetical protein
MAFTGGGWSATLTGGPTVHTGTIAKNQTLGGGSGSPRTYTLTSSTAGTLGSFTVAVS